MRNKVKNALFYCMLVALLAPSIQQQCLFTDTKPLNGFFTNAHDTALSLTGWMNGSYQKNEFLFINDNTGFRADLIRVCNEEDYILFHKAHSEWRILTGHDDVIYQDLQLYAYTGKDYIGRDSIFRKMTLLKSIQDTLKHLGKSFVVIYAPNKADFYAESIPKELVEKRDRTNIQELTRIGDSIGINQIDFNSWFITMKRHNAGLLYPKQGFHWSVYGALIAADSFEKFLDFKCGMRLPRMVITDPSKTKIARYTDDDLAKGLNLIFPITSETFTYPRVSYKSDYATTRPKVVYIGDSFLFTWMNAGFMDSTSSDWQLWYYFRHLVNSVNHEPETLPMPRNWIARLEKADCIILMYTPRNLAQFGDGFIEQAYEHFYPSR